MNTLLYFRNDGITFHLLSCCQLWFSTMHQATINTSAPVVSSLLRRLRFSSQDLFLTLSFQLAWLSFIFPLFFLFFKNMSFVQSETLLPLAAPCSHIKQRHGGKGGKMTEWKTTETMIKIGEGGRQWHKQQWQDSWKVVNNYTYKKRVYMRVGQSGMSVCQYYTGNYSIRQTQREIGNDIGANTNLHVYLQCEELL